MYLKLLVFVLLCNTSFSVFSQNAAATEKKANLPTPTLDEISGMIFWNGKLYGHQDGGNSPVLFEIDSTTGAITKTITLSVTYTSIDDWEDITEDETYIYIGNFGNNANGSRKDLKIYRVLKSAIAAITGATGTVASNDIDVINFSYPDQTKFCPADFTCADSANNTTFDCEAVIVNNGVLHLFTKDWVNARTVHYSIPAIPGTYVATRLEEFNTGGLLITAATKINDKVIALLGYNDPRVNPLNTRCGLWLIMGFTDMNNIFSVDAGKTKIDLGKLFSWPQASTDKGQLEAMAAVSGSRILIAGERFEHAALSVNVPPQLYGVELGGFIPQAMILPEGITNFISRTSDNTTVLSWEYSDNGADFFEVQRSTTSTDSDFKTIGKINAKNNSLHEYDFSCNSSSSDKVYYRIKATTYSGRNLFSKIIIVQNNEEKGFNLKASPSPFNNQVAVSFYSSLNQQIQISLTNALGRTIVIHTIKAIPGNYSLQLDGLNGLSSGIYFLTCRTRNDVVVKKIVKQ